MAIECKHGQLARSCQLCELEAEIERLRGALDVIISIGRGEQGNCDSCLRMEQVAQAALDAAGE